MKKKEYLPQSDTKLSQWSTDFATQFAAQAAGLGFSAEDVTVMSTACGAVSGAIDNANAARIAYEQKVSEKKATVDSNTAAIREMVRRIKAAPAYTEAIGKLLGVIGEGSSFDPATAVPEITLGKSATGYDFKFSLHNYFSAVVVYRRNPGETDFAQVAIDMKSPYSIATPASGTEFYFQYFRDDQLIGQPSDIIVIKL
ncbi:MAG: hypothetical protein ABIA75_04935 [Candidatus Neomarinimicrobiota bacterium]